MPNGYLMQYKIGQPELKTTEKESSGVTDKTLGELIFAFSLAGLTFYSAPKVLQTFKEIWNTTKDNWGDMTTGEKAVYLFLASGNVLPYFTFALIWYIKYLKSKEK